jgi:hypothetical protein
VTRPILSIVIYRLNEESGIVEIINSIPKRKVYKVRYDSEFPLIDGNFITPITDMHYECEQK